MTCEPGSEDPGLHPEVLTPPGGYVVRLWLVAV